MDESTLRSFIIEHIKNVISTHKKTPAATRTLAAIKKAPGVDQNIEGIDTPDKLLALLEPINDAVPLDKKGRVIAIQKLLAHEKAG